MPASDAGLLVRLCADGLIERRDGVYRTTRRWQGAIARAALRLLRTQGDGSDVRLPIAEALNEIYGQSVSDEELTALVQTMLPIEARELDPRSHLHRPAQGE